MRTNSADCLPNDKLTDAGPETMNSTQPQSRRSVQRLVRRIRHDRCDGSGQPTKQSEYATGLIDVTQRRKWSVCPVCTKHLNVPSGAKAPWHKGAVLKWRY
jgi:hypothetical protein